MIDSCNLTHVVLLPRLSREDFTLVVLEFTRLVSSDVIVMLK